MSDSEQALTTATESVVHVPGCPVGSACDCKYGYEPNHGEGVGQPGKTESDGAGLVGRPRANVALGAPHPSDIIRARDELRRRARAARAEAAADPDHVSPRAAALRGKAKGYDEGADLIEAALQGGRVHRKWGHRG